MRALDPVPTNNLIRVCDSDVLDCKQVPGCVLEHNFFAADRLLNRPEGLHWTDLTRPPMAMSIPSKCSRAARSSLRNWLRNSLNGGAMGVLLGASNSRTSSSKDIWSSLSSVA